MQQQQRAAKPDPNLLRLQDSRHYKKHTRIAFAVLFFVFAAVVGGIVLWLVLTRGPSIVGDRFIELVSHNKIDRAYVEASTIELRQRMSLEQFADLVARLKLDKAKSTSWSVRRQEAVRQELLGHIDLNDGSKTSVVVTFAQEFDDWKVDAFDLAPPGS